MSQPYGISGDDLVAPLRSLLGLIRRSGCIKVHSGARDLLPEKNFYTLALIEEIPKMQMQKSVRILFLAANPMATSRLDLEEELRLLERELRSVEYRDEIDLIPAHAVRPDDVIWLLRQEAPTVVHFSGHGSQQGIVLRGDSSELEVSAPALARVLSDRNIQMVVLNSCLSDFQAEALAGVVPVVVGTTAEVGDEAARRFSVAFYRTIGNGHTVGDAFRDGRDSVDINMLEEAFKLRGDSELLLCGRRERSAQLKTTAELIGVIRRLTDNERLVFRAILKASPEIDKKAFREFFKAPNVISGNQRDAYRFRLEEMVRLNRTELAQSLKNLIDYFLIFGEQLTDILYQPSPEVVAIVNRSYQAILGLLYTTEEIQKRPVEVFYGSTHFRDGKPYFYVDSDGVPLEGPYRLDEKSNHVTYFRDGKVAGSEESVSG